MNGLSPWGSQENVPPSTAKDTPTDEEPTSSPALPTSGSQYGSKPRKPPTITPRSFTRFFTPKSSMKRGGRIGKSRKALRDITAAASNRGDRGTSSKGILQVFDDESNGILETSKRRKRKIPNSEDVTLDRSSPLKRIRNQSLELSENGYEDGDPELEEEAEEESLSQAGSLERGNVYKLHNISPSKYHGGLGRDLRRETGACGRMSRSCTLDPTAGGSKNWQHETTNFFSKPEDVHICNNVAEPTENSVPFCTASCNTNSLVAVGDEDGGIRLLDSERDEKPGFSKAYVTFRPHANAILDLAFSPDDLLLATASGDQTSHVIDMQTQKTTCVLSGHSSSVKQVCFQPGSSNVIITSSRDGTVQVWDLRCKSFDAPKRAIKIPLEAPTDDAVNPPISNRLAWGRSVNTILEAHQRHQVVQVLATGTTLPQNVDPPSKTEAPGRRGDVSITALQFLPPGREHLLLTASEADASVKLWDLRTTHNHRRGRATPLSSTRPTGAHMKHRHFGVTSLSLSGDGARLYTVCRDNTIYAYATSHLILGHAPELSRNMYKSRPRRMGGQEKQGLGPIYGFRHPAFHASSFYVKSTTRLAEADRTELMAVGSSDGCAVLFPTDERYMQQSNDRRMRPSDPFGWHQSPSRRAQSDTSFNIRLEDSIPIYQHGSALIRGHSREVTGLCWTSNGELVTVGDDYMVRCWREGAQARDLRMGGEKEGRRWGCGWAEADSGWDDEDG